VPESGAKSSQPASIRALLGVAPLNKAISQLRVCMAPGGDRSVLLRHPKVACGKLDASAASLPP